MFKRPNRRDSRAIDRQVRESYPANNFALVALVLAGLIVLIGIGFATGFIR